MKTPAEIARTFGCTEAQAIDQLRANLDAMRQMQKKAAVTGRSVNGYTQAELERIAADIAEALEACASLN